MVTIPTSVSQTGIRRIWYAVGTASAIVVEQMFGWLAGAILFVMVLIGCYCVHLAAVRGRQDAQADYARALRAAVEEQAEELNHQMTRR